MFLTSEPAERQTTRKAGDEEDGQQLEEEEEEELVEEFDLIEIPGPDQEEGLLVLLEETRDKNLTVQPAGPRDETAGKDTLLNSSNNLLPNYWSRNYLISVPATFFCLISARFPLFV